MVSESTFLRIVRASAWYDLIVTAPFATPWTFALLHQALSALAHALGIGSLPPFEPTHLLMANHAGIGTGMLAAAGADAGVAAQAAANGRQATAHSTALALE